MSISPDFFAVALGTIVFLLTVIIGLLHDIRRKLL